MLVRRRIGHQSALSNSILRVPLVIWDGRGPGRARIEERVGLVDLAPTLLELAGVAAPAGLDGRSLVPVLRGERLGPRPYFGSVRLGPRRKPKNALVEAVRKKMETRLGEFEYDTAVYEGALKLLVGPEKRALFDLSKDPRELSPLSQKDHAASYDRLGALVGSFRNPGQPAREPVPVSDEVREQLRALGYTE